MAHKLAVNIYRLTKDFPKEEVYGLTSQMRRCAVSVSSNIVEGFSRPSDKEKRPFYSVALASLAELQCQLMLSRDLGYLKKEVFENVSNSTVEARKVLYGLRKSIQTSR